MITVGDLITLPHLPQWGIGQIQSIIGSKVTANFENAGKQVLDIKVVKIKRISYLLNSDNKI